MHTVEHSLRCPTSVPIRFGSCDFGPKPTLQQVCLIQLDGSKIGLNQILVRMPKLILGYPTVQPPIHGFC